jgi:hypothetical protein
MPKTGLEKNTDSAVNHHADHPASSLRVVGLSRDAWLTAAH